VSVLRAVRRFVHVRHPYLWCAGVSLGIVILSLGARNAHGGTLHVTQAALTAGVIQPRIVATGTLEATTTVQVGAQVSGTIQWLGADFNSIVRAGDVLARLEPSLFRAALEQNEAALAEARGQLAQAHADENTSEVSAADARAKLARTEELALRLLVPIADLDAAHATMDEASASVQSAGSLVTLAEAAVARAAAAVEQARVDLDHTIIPSPIDGIIVARNVDVGQTIAAAVQAPVLFTIATNLTRMQVVVDVDEADIGGVRSGAAAAFQVESYPAETFHGAVSDVRLQPVAPPSVPPAPGGAETGAAASAPTTVSYATIVDVANGDRRLRPGMTATVTIDRPPLANVVRIPNSALSFRPPEQVLDAAGQTPDVGSAATVRDPAVRRVWKFDGARFMPLDVRVGLADGDWTQLVNGSLRPGEELVTNAFVDRRR